jgi:hypothetical protein
MIEMRSMLHQIGFALCIGTTAICAVLHVATFLTIVPLNWIVLPVFLILGAVICARRVALLSRFSLHRKLTPLGCALIVYAVLTFGYFYQTTGGASSVGIVDGQYVSKYQGRVIRIVTEREYKCFPNLWTRVMSAWIGMTAVFCLSAFLPQDRP